MKAIWASGGMVIMEGEKLEGREYCEKRVTLTVHDRQRQCANLGIACREDVGPGVVDWREGSIEACEHLFPGQLCRQFDGLENSHSKQSSIRMVYSR